MPVQAVRQNVVIAQIKSKWKQEQKRRRKVRTVLKNAPEGQAKQSELEILTERLRQLGEDMSEMDDKWLEVPPTPFPLFPLLLPFVASFFSSLTLCRQADSIFCLVTISPTEVITLGEQDLQKFVFAP